ncbi:hypothetical protein CEXT_625231 [Caerostris extrusa]|uniref:Uncharacterized protein n=1 Tax=Caerostris extrusa TaxID=172846 RepID=A0AAV4NHZ6_CAEEX|nr:hypothetical protein CEXT_625231 [Caerostris extrusa]
MEKTKKESSATLEIISVKKKKRCAVPSALTFKSWLLTYEFHKTHQTAPIKGPNFSLHMARWRYKSVFHEIQDFHDAIDIVQLIPSTREFL